MSQAALAEKVNATRQTIPAIEKGRFVLSTALALKISSVLKIKVDDLLNWKNQIRFKRIPVNIGS